jgi:hypothetical protein
MQDQPNVARREHRHRERRAFELFMQAGGDALAR